MPILIVLALVFSGGVQAAVKMVTSSPDIAWAAKEIAGGKVEVKSLLKGTENPHYVEAVPDFVRQVASSDVVCSVGLDLEVGWIPKVLSKSGNAQVQPGGKGYCELGKSVQALEKPTGPVDRSMGDVHPLGNPHFWLSPKHFGQAAEEIAKSLSTVDPANGETYRKGLTALQKRLAKIQEENLGRVANKKNISVLEYHKEFSYFFEAYQLRSFGSLEEKPGVTPSAGRLADLAKSAKAAGVKVVLASDTAPRKVLERFQELSGIPYVVVPVSLQPGRGLNDYAELQRKLLNAVLTPPQGTL